MEREVFVFGCVERCVKLMRVVVLVRFCIVCEVGVDFFFFGFVEGCFNRIYYICFGIVVFVVGCNVVFMVGFGMGLVVVDEVFIFVVSFFFFLFGLIVEIYLLRVYFLLFFLILIVWLVV